MSGSGLLNPKAVAGSPSVTKLTQSSWTGISASGIPIAAVKKIQATSPMFEEIKYLKNKMHLGQVGADLENAILS